MGRAVAVLAMAALLAACVSPPNSYIVLLPNPDGTVGSVMVRSERGEQVISQARQGVLLDGSKDIFAIPQAQIEQDFGAAIAARPPLPEHYLLFFELGSNKLTAESQRELPRILDRARARTTADISVIGHTDTLDKASSNEVLGLKRAEAIAEQLKQLGLENIQLSIESQGLRNLLVPTPMGVAEPRNRRVEITIR
ncbi:OmpA family protein [Polaromonas sp. OV174]|nr:OmpA family protein [Polaromonas sp. OV174]